MAKKKTTQKGKAKPRAKPKPSKPAKPGRKARPAPPRPIRRLTWGSAAWVTKHPSQYPKELVERAKRLMGREMKKRNQASLGGHARAKKLSKERQREIARKASAAAVVARRKKAAIRRRIRALEKELEAVLSMTDVEESDLDAAVELAKQINRDFETKKRRAGL